MTQLELFESQLPPVNSATKPKAKATAKATQPIWLSVHYSPRMKRTWRFQWKRPGILGRLRGKTEPQSAELHLPAYFKEPTFAEALEIVFQWAELSVKRRTTPIRQRIIQLEKEIWKKVDQCLAQSGRSSVSEQRRMPSIQSQGRIHHLEPHFNWINERYFGGELQCTVTWSSRIGGLSYHSRRKDPKTGLEMDLVSITQGYDFENCPEYALRGILYHECLHIAVPPVLKDGRREVHGKEFRFKEKQYEFYKEWKLWHATVLPRNIRQLKRALKTRSSSGK